MMNKKRKFQDGQLGLHQPNHRAFDLNYTPLPEKPQSKIDSKVKNVDKLMMNDRMDGGDESDNQDSAKDSNSIHEFSSSANCNSSTEHLRFGESYAVAGDSALYYEDHSMEFGGFESKSDEIEGYCTQKEIEDLLYSNDTTANKFILSSGRWEVKQDQSEKGTKSLTIDKEFEQYFSMLML